MSVQKHWLVGKLLLTLRWQLQIQKRRFQLMLKLAHSEINTIYSLYVGMQRSNDMVTLLNYSIKWIHFSLNIAQLELSNTHSRYIRMQQSNDIELRWHVCKRWTRQDKLLITLRLQLQIKKIRFQYKYFLARDKQHPLMLCMHSTRAIKWHISTVTRV
jgi:hypothetical protein